MKLALIGVGMIGGSVAAAWRATGLVSRVVGFDADPQALSTAQSLKIIDESAANIAQAVSGADIVLVAVPVGAMNAVFAQMARHLSAGCVVTDVGSTKSQIVDAARAQFASPLPNAFGHARFVPAHPIAGSEQQGVVAFDSTLFEKKAVVLTPDMDTDPAALALVEQLWSRCGARVQRMRADEHDRIFAAVSHLPHVLAFALVAHIADMPDGDRKLALSGSGFRDFTRIAASSPVMWRDIVLANQAALSEALRGYRAWLDQLQLAVDTADGEKLFQMFERASLVRRRISGALDAQ